MSKLSVLVLLVVAVLAATAAQTNGPKRIRVGLRHQNYAEFDKLFWDITSPTSKNYGKWLSLSEMSRLIGASNEDVARITNFLRSHGGQDITLLPSRDWMEATVPADVASFITEFLTGKDSVDLSALSNAHRDVVAEYDAIVEVAYEVLTLEEQRIAYEKISKDFVPSANLRKFKKLDDAAFAELSALFDGSPNGQKSAYNMPTDLVGSYKNNSQMVWGTGTYGFSKSDLGSFFQQFNVPASVNDLYSRGFKGTAGGDNYGEATLDVTYISSLAPGVKTIVYNSNDSQSTEWGLGFGYAFLDFTQNMAQESIPPFVLSLSLGSLSWDSCHILCDKVAQKGVYTRSQCVSYMNSQRQVCMYDSSDQINRIDKELQKLGARGITITASSGDGGSHFSFGAFDGSGIGRQLNSIACQLNFPVFPAESAFVTAVGGTDWTDPAAPYAWSASGGGFSWRFPVPDYQAAVVSNYLRSNAGQSGFPPSGAFNATNRAYPDIAALANNVPMNMGGSVFNTGGTSASAPEWGGIFSMINDKRLKNGLPSLGFVNPRLYKLAADHPGEAFYDVTQGVTNCGSDGFCCSTGFPAVAGYDPMTGLGSPLWPGLIKYLGSDS